VSEQLVPIHREPVIPGELSVLVYEDEVSLGVDRDGGVAPRVPVWVFASSGLESAGQRELVLGILRITPRSRIPRIKPRPRPRSPFALAATAYQQARAGTVLEEGSRFEVRGGRVDFDPRVSGFVCLHYALHNLQLPAIDTDSYRRSPLLLLPLLPEELQAADMFGNARVVALLAKDSRCHPFPWWHDPRRPSVVAAGEPPSMLAELPVPRAHTPYVEVIQTGSRLDIVVPIDECSQLHELLTAAPKSFVLLTGVAAEAPARYFWEPGQTQPSATTCGHGQGTKNVPPGELEVAGNFLMLLHGELTNDAHLREDGFAVMMAEPTWRQFTAALKAHEPFTWRTDDEHISEVSLQPGENRYVSPFGEVYQGEGPFRTYRSSPRAQPAQGTQKLHNIEVQQIPLLSAQYQFSQALSTEALAAYIGEACTVIDDTMEGVVHRGEEACVQFRLAPSTQPMIQLAVRPPDPQAFPSRTAQLLLDRLNTLPAPAVTKHELRFEVRFTFPPDHITSDSPPA
jgi:hypothetical protein